MSETKDCSPTRSPIWACACPAIPLQEAQATGQYVTARAEIGRIPGALLIPQQAVSELQCGTQVVIVNPDGKAEIRAVKTGPVYGHMIVVTEGQITV